MTAGSASRTFDGVGVLVTGGASGLGQATVRHFVALGASAVIADIDAAGGEKLAAELGDRARFVATDVRDEEQVRRAAAAAGEAPRGLRLAVTCAGAGTLTPALSAGRVPFPTEIYERTVDVNLKGTFHVLRLAAAGMAGNEPDEEGQRGVVVLTASIAAFDGQAGQIAYAASKGGVVSMTLPAARDLAPFGIRVCSIAPGSFDTPLLDGFYTEEARALTASNIPFPSRLGRPQEFASLVEYIASNAMLNGSTIRLDGAQRLGAVKGGLMRLLEGVPPPG